MRSGLWLIMVVCAVVALPTGQALFGEDPSVEVPEPRVGDVGVYDVIDALPTMGPDEDANASVAFEIKPQELRSDAYDRDREMWPMVLEPDPIVEPEGDPNDEDHRVGWLPHTTWVVGIGEDAAVTDRWNSLTSSNTYRSHPLYEEEREVEMTRQISYAYEQRRLAGAACFLTSGFAGMTLEEDTNVSQVPVCGQPLIEYAGGEDANATASVTEITEEGPTKAWVTIQAHNVAGEATLELAYQDGIPYPVEVIASLEITGTNPRNAAGGPSILDPVMFLARGETGEHLPPPNTKAFTAHLELTGYGEGTDPPLPRVDDQEWPTSPVIDVAPLDRWGPVDDGASVAYPYRDAVQHIQDDPTLASFHGWMQENPDAKLTLAFYTEIEQYSTTELWWILLFMSPDGEVRSVSSSMKAEPSEGSYPEELNPARVINEDHSTPLDSRDSSGSLCEDPFEDRPDSATTLSAAVDLWHRKTGGHADGSAPNLMIWHAPACWGRATLFTGWQEPRGQSSPAEWVQDDEQAFGESMVLIDADQGVLMDIILNEGTWTRDSTVDLGASSTPSPGTPSDEEGLVQIDQASPLAGGAAATGLVAILIAIALKLGWFPLYSRIHDDELVDHPVRRALLDRLEEAPGEHLSALARAVDRDRSTAAHHLAKLKEAGFVENVNTNGASRWFRAGHLPEGSIETEALLSTGRTRDVYEAIEAAPGTSLTSVADRLDMHASSVHRIVDRLREGGLVEKEREGRRIALTPSGPKTRQPSQR